MATRTDIIIIGSGMGGATMAAALAPTGRQILILERGERLADTAHARDAGAVFVRGHYRNEDLWETPEGQAFQPGNYACVGGNSKHYGAVLIRFREADFQPVQHLGGTSLGWPISYDALEPWYQAAEQLYRVRGDAAQDPTEPPHSGPYPFAPVPHEADIKALSLRLKAQGLSPAPLPLGVDLEAWLAHGHTPWDGFPDTTGAKCDAESVGLARALEHRNVRLLTGTYVRALKADAAGRITEVNCERDGQRVSFQPQLVVLAAGAVNSAALLLRSVSERFPHGLANRSDQVGRNFMNHNCSAVLAIHPLKRNRAIYQKTLMLNDFYLGGGPEGAPLGNVQLLGKISGPILAANSACPLWLARLMAARSVDFYAMSEDLPDPDSRVWFRNGRIVLDWRRSNMAAHRALVARLKSVLRRAGFPLVLSAAFDRRTPSHQCGTLRMGVDPRASVVTPECRSHDHPNLFITDAGVFPTSSAVNPGLTIAALALRAANHIIERGAA